MQFSRIKDYDLRKFGDVGFILKNLALGGLASAVLFTTLNSFSLKILPSKAYAQVNPAISYAKQQGIYGKTALHFIEILGKDNVVDKEEKRFINLLARIPDPYEQFRLAYKYISLDKKVDENNIGELEKIVEGWGQPKELKEPVKQKDQSKLVQPGGIYILEWPFDIETHIAGIAYFDLDQDSFDANVIFNDNGHVLTYKCQEIQFTDPSKPENFDTTNPTGKFMISLLGSVAQLERDTLIERSKMGILKSIKEGHYMASTSLYGYDYNRQTKKLEINPYESEIVKLIFKLYQKSFSSELKVAAKLNQLNYHTRKGAQWTITQIHRILNHPGYYGKWSYGNDSERITIDIPPQEIENYQHAGALKSRD